MGSARSGFASVMLTGGGDWMQMDLGSFFLVVTVALCVLFIKIAPDYIMGLLNIVVSILRSLKVQFIG